MHIHNQTMTHETEKTNNLLHSKQINMLVRKFLYVPYFEIIGSILVSACLSAHAMGPPVHKK